MRRILSAALIVALGASALFLAAVTKRVDARASSPFPIASPVRYEASRELVPAFVKDTLVPGSPLPVPRRLGAGETLSDALRTLGMASADLESAVGVAVEQLDPRRLPAGLRYSGWYSPSGELLAVSFDLDGKGRFELTRADSGWQGHWHEFRTSLHVRHADGVLHSSLAAAVVDAGAEAAVAYRMADVLQWDVDFNRDLQPNDRFDVLWEETRVEGRFYKVGEVLALVLENGGRRLEAYRFEDGYYDGEGRPLRKLFLRSPLRYSRITSSFSRRRFHPILKTYRPHYGVDFGAPVGTPVRATAAGIVVSAGWTNGGGKTVTLRHPNAYETSYLHLSRFADGIRSGHRVRQGDVIGFVGSTGLATAPHLDYRVRHDGKWVNPAGLRNEPSPPIAPSEMARFFARRDELRAGLIRFYGGGAPETILADLPSERAVGPTAGR